MRSSAASRAELLEPLSRPPESVAVTGVSGRYGSLSIAACPTGVVRAHLELDPDGLAVLMERTWGSRVISDDSSFGDLPGRVAAWLDGEDAPLGCVVQPVLITPFTLAVHRLLTEIPLGTVLTYGEVAARLDRPGAARAVGNACGRNDVPLIVPCHRVVAANGPGGFGSGLALKRALLALEGVSL